MSRHTKGPWRVKHQHGGFCSIVYTEKKTLSKGQYYPEVGSLSDGSIESPTERAEGVRHLVLVNKNPAVTKTMSDNLEEMKANAQLISAAPELLELAQLVQKLNPDEGLSADALFFLRQFALKAIAKAEGRE